MAAAARYRVPALDPFGFFAASSSALRTTTIASSRVPQAGRRADAGSKQGQPAAIRTPPMCSA